MAIYKIMHQKLFTILMMLAWGLSLQAQSLNQSFFSPNEKIEWQANGETNKIQSFSISYHDGKKSHPVMQLTNYGLLTKDGGGKNLTLLSISNPHRIQDSYTMLTGKKKKCNNEANEIIYSFQDTLKRNLRMVVRLYNDGVAFHYELDGLQHTSITEDLTTYHIPSGTNRWMQEWQEAYEGFFPHNTTGESKSHHWGYPALIQSDPTTWSLITEAGIERFHSASSLKNEKKLTDYQVFLDENTQHFTGSWSSAWRVIIIGKKQDLVSSTLVTDVSAPCRVSDTSWIKPGSVSWIYWAHNHGSNDYQIVKQYIDMAVKLKLPYVLIDAEWDEMGNGGTIEDALHYAKEQNVKVLIWYNSSTGWLQKDGAPGPHERLNAPENREKEFAWLEKMGVAGVKIDFFAGDKQETMEYCIDLLEAAARHHLTVNFHGATIPRGWQRTYPHLLSTEGVYGAEWYNNKATLTNKAACHNATLPFTRGIVGSMDYTPCTFSDSQHPHITTHAHELALPVLFESALMHWADRPESYLAQPKEVQQFIGELPTTWDETRLLSGYPGEQVVMARRKGHTWYVAGINGKDVAQTVQVDWQFLNKRKSRTILFMDKDNKKNPWYICKKSSSNLPSKFNLLPRGGFVIVIK